MGTFFLILFCACASPATSSEAYDRDDRANVFLAASEFLVGENRFPFVISDPEDREPMEQRLEVRFYLLSGDNKAELGAEESATYRQISGVIPHSICNLDQLNWSAYGFDGEDSYINDNQLCPSYPQCIEEYVGFQNTISK